MDILPACPPVSGESGISQTSKRAMITHVFSYLGKSWANNAKIKGHVTCCNIFVGTFMKIQILPLVQSFSHEVVYQLVLLTYLNV